MAYGKITWLPREIREQLNRRLAQGEPGKRIVDWLNGLPAVQRVLDESFQGRKITDGNLSDWKQSGHQSWLALQEKLVHTRIQNDNADDLARQVKNKSLADKLAMEIAARYAELVADWNGRADKVFEQKIRGLRILGQEIARLRRGDHSSGRLQLARDKEDHDNWDDDQLAYYRVMKPLDDWPRAKRAFEIAWRIYRQERENHHGNGRAKPRRVQGPDANGVIRVMDPDGTW